MKKRKKQAVTLAVAAVMALIPAALCGNAPNSEAEPAATITLATPEIEQEGKESDTYIRLAITGDSDGYLRIGTAQSSASYITKSTSTYTMILTPGKDQIGVVCPYYWVRSAMDYNGTTYVSSALTFANIYRCKLGVTDGVNSGTLSKTATTFSLDSSVTSVEFVCVYAGECSTGESSLSNGFTYTSSVNGVTFTVTGGVGYISVKTSKTITCSDCSASDSTYGAFAFYAA